MMNNTTKRSKPKQESGLAYLVLGGAILCGTIIMVFLGRLDVTWLALAAGIPVAAGYACAAVLIAGLVVGQLVRGEPLNWVLLIGVVAFIVTGRPAFVFCRDEFRASRIRKKRGVPRPDRAQEIQLSDVDGPGAALIDLRKRPEIGLQG